MATPPQQQQQQDAALRFEDLTIDDDLPPLERVTRYCKSSIALQRLVHVKMMAETAEATGQDATVESILPLVPPLSADPESIIRQHVAMQLLPVSFACVGYKPPPTMDGSTTNVDGETSSSSSSTEMIERNNSYYYREPYYSKLTRDIIPTLANLISDPDGDVRQAAAQSIAGIVQHRLLKHDDVAPLVLPIPLRLSHFTCNLADKGSKNAPPNAVAPHGVDAADMRMTAAALFGDLSPALGTVLVKEFVTSELTSLASDATLKVRRVVASHSLPKACSVADEEDITNRLFPAFEKLCSDEQKGVRRACAESIVELAKVPHLPSRLRNEKLVELWKKLERDQMRTVKYAALQKLGYFIATFAPPPPPSPSPSSLEGSTSTTMTQPTPPAPLTGDKLIAVNELVPYFTGMAFIKTGDVQEEAEIRLHCAFCFPAVVYTFGLMGWNTLRDAFFHLAQGPEEEIPGGKANTNNTILRRCLACSLHEVAKVLGERVVEDELLDLFETFLKDNSEDVRLSALRNFHQIIGVVSIKKREPLLELLNDMLSTSSPMNWRMRNSVAKQLNRIICYFKAHSVRNKIAPLVFKLLDDPVAEVREQTYSSVPTLLKHMFWVNIVKNEVPDIFTDEMDAEEWSAKAIKEVLRVLQSLPTMEDFSHRQSFCQITGCVAESVQSPDSSVEEAKFFRKILNLDLIPLVLSLREDKVSNVRILLRKCLLCMPDDIMSNPEVAVTLRDLQKEQELWEEATTSSTPSRGGGGNSDSTTTAAASAAGTGGGSSSRRSGGTTRGSTSGTRSSTRSRSATNSGGDYDLRSSTSSNHNNEDDETSVNSSTSSRRGGSSGTSGRTKRGDKQTGGRKSAPPQDGGGRYSTADRSASSQRRRQKNKGDDDSNNESGDGSGNVLAII